MTIPLIILCVCLLVIMFILLYKLLLLKRNIRHFSDELEKRKNTEYDQPIKVSDFDQDITEFAVKINEHTDIQRKLRIEYDNSKRHLGYVITGISHDFHTPLTAALGYMQMIKKSGELSEKNSEYLQIAIQKNKYLQELSNEFFEITKLESKNIELNIEKLNLSNYITEKILEQNQWVKQRKINTDFDIQEEIFIMTDVHLFTRIMNNLMSNAQKYTADKFGVSLINTNGSTALKVYNSITDIGSVNIEKVFEPFYRIESRTSEGSGLGLYVVKFLCDKLGFNVQAKLCDNNTFCIQILI